MRRASKRNAMGFSEDNQKARRLLQDLTDRGLGAGSPADSPGNTQSTPDDLLLGKIALERGLVTPEQLQECIRQRASMTAQGNKSLLGKILIERGYLKTEDVLELLQEQTRRSQGIPNLSRYEIHEKAGEGATAVVYRALDCELKRPVALKVLREGPGLSAIGRERFRREAQTAAGLAHPNLIQVYDTGEADGQLYIVMELVEGRPLSEILAEGRASRKELVEILEQAARGVAAAHEKGIVHRDLKPANILVSASGTPKVGDFGLAHLSEGATVLTLTGSALGTPLYMSPEQVEGRSKDITARTDVYALGAILYEILTRRPPHSGDTLGEIYGKIVHEEPTAPRKLDAKVSADLETIALKALEKDAGKRYPAAQAFAEDLRRALDGEPILAKPLSAPARLWRTLVRRRALVLSGAASGVSVAVLIIVLASRRNESLEGVRISREAKESRWVLEGQAAKFEVTPPVPSSSGSVAARLDPSLSGAGGNSAEPSRSGLAASYDFEEGAGPTTADGSGNGNTATLMGGVTRTPGQRGSGLRFDGASGYLTVPNAPSLNMGMKSFTVACWVKPTSNEPYRVLNLWDGKRGWLFDLNTGPGASKVPGVLRLKISDGLVLIDYNANGPIAIGVWQHVAATVDRSANQLSLYLNGAQIGFPQSLSGMAESVDQRTPLGMGQIPSGLGDHQFSGAMKGVRLYARALSPSEMASLARSPEAAPDKDRALSSGKPAPPAISPLSAPNEGVRLRYQWQRQSPGETDWRNVGTDAPSFTLPATSRSDHGALFRVIVSSSSESLTSSSGLLLVTPLDSLPATAAAWAFDEGSGTSTADSSGNGNSGTLVNAPNWTAGKDGSALLFGNGGYVAVNNSPSLDVSGTGFTVSFWANLAAMKEDKEERVLIDKPWDALSQAPDAKASDYQYGLEYVTRSECFYLLLGDTEKVFRRFEVPGVLGTWAHVAFTYDGRYIKGYLDGELRFSGSASFHLAARGTPLRIGVDRKGSRPANGKLDNIRIYAWALGSSQIQADLRTAVGGITTKMSLTGDLGTSATDKSSVPKGWGRCAALGIEGPLLAGLLWLLRRGRRAGPLSAPAPRVPVLGPGG
jgi:serine/threonine protein kinase